MRKRPLLRSLLVVGGLTLALFAPMLATMSTETVQACAQRLGTSLTTDSHQTRQLTSQADSVAKVTLPDGRVADEYRFTPTHSGSDDHGLARAFAPPVTYNDGAGNKQYWHESEIAILHLSEPVFECDEITYRHSYNYRFSLWGWKGDYDTIWGDEEVGVPTDWRVYAFLQTNHNAGGWTRASPNRHYLRTLTLTCRITSGMDWTVIEDDSLTDMRFLLTVRPTYKFKWNGQGQWLSVPYGQIFRETASQSMLANGSVHTTYNGVLTGVWSGQVPQPGQGQGSYAC
jgi:hypothetical protein